MNFTPMSWTNQYLCEKSFPLANNNDQTTSDADYCCTMLEQFSAQTPETGSFFVVNDIDTKEITTAKFIEIMKNAINRKIVQIVPLLVYVIKLRSTNASIYFPFYSI